MHPEKLGISACDLESLQQDQSTQTSSFSIDKISRPSSKSSRPPLPREISKSDKGSITIFEFCQVVQNPESPEDVTIIKETVSEEVKPHTSDKSDESKTNSIQEFVANRYKYCKEVIRPYLKHTTDCPETEEELIKSALDSASEDFPDYQPCFEVFDGEKDISQKTTGSTCFDKVDACTVTSSSMETNKANDKLSCPSKSSDNVVVPPTPAEKCKEQSRDSSPDLQCPKKKSVDKIKKKCSQTKTDLPKDPNQDIPCHKEPTIGVKCQKPSYYLTERCIDTDSIPNLPARQEETFVDNHKKTISTIKVAMEDLAEKVTKATKQAVSAIATESAKQIDKVKQMTPESINSSETKKFIDNKTSETLTSFNFFRKVENTGKEADDNKPELPKISDLISNIVGKVDSTISMLTSNMTMDNVPKGLKPPNFNDSSSEYDKPITKGSPRDVSNVLTHAPVPQSNSVFAAIKDKIVSMFREEEPKPTKTESQSSISSSNSSKKDDNDESLTDKVIK